MSITVKSVRELRELSKLGHVDQGAMLLRMPSGEVETIDADIPKIPWELLTPNLLGGLAEEYAAAGHDKRIAMLIQHGRTREEAERILDC